MKTIGKRLKEAEKERVVTVTSEGNEFMLRLNSIDGEWLLVEEIPMDTEDVFALVNNGFFAYESVSGHMVWERVGGEWS